LHPVRIAEGYDKACQIAVKRLAEISDEVDVRKGDASKTLFNTASTTLSSKIINVHRDQVIVLQCA
jgi:T-complex protein 1 subunit epsilon